MSIYPISLKLTPDQQLQIEWSDGRHDQIAVRQLRDRCPCATCREQRNAPPATMTMLPILSAAEVRPLTLRGMTPVGNYAYSLDFSDGHDTGIFTFEFLREVGES